MRTKTNHSVVRAVTTAKKPKKPDHPCLTARPPIRRCVVETVFCFFALPKLRLWWFCPPAIGMLAVKFVCRFVEGFSPLLRAPTLSLVAPPLFLGLSALSEQGILFAGGENHLKNL